MEGLESFTRDLVQEAREGKLDSIIGREQELRRTMQILGRRSKNNPVLVGQPGVGKTAIVEALALRIAEGSVPDSLATKRILALDLAQLLAGTRFRGDFEERLKAVVGAAMADPSIILFIDELHSLVGTGSGEGAMDAANMLKPALARREFSCIGATTVDEYERYVSKDKALSRRFQPVVVREPSEEDALVIMRGIKERYESHHRVRIADAALCAAVRIAMDHIPGRYLPDKAIDLVDEAASLLKLRLESVPEELAMANETLVRLRIELRAVESEMDTGDDRDALADRVAAAERKAEWLRSEWEEQRATVGEIRSLLKREEELRNEEEQARRDDRLDRAAAIAYAELPELSRRIEALEERLDSREDGAPLMRDCVLVEDVLQVAAMWTGLSEAALSEDRPETGETHPDAP